MIAFIITIVIITIITIIIICSRSSRSGSTCSSSSSSSSSIGLVKDKYLMIILGQFFLFLQKNLILFVHCVRKEAKLTR